MKVTIISGFLGSGKTTLLRRLLREQKARSLGVIVNDMADLEVDGDLLRAGERVSEEHGNFISLYAGSISGDRRTAFAQALEQWQDRSDLEHVLVETSGSTHPWPLIEELVKRLAYEIDTFVTLLDVKAFIEDYGAGKLLFEELIRNEAQRKRSTANLLAEQIQFADLILLTKTDRIRTEDLPFVIKCLEILNPQAKVLPVTYGQIPAARLLGSGGFSLGRVRLLANAWRQSSSETLGEAESYDISSSVVCEARPFHPRRLWTLFRTRLGRGIHRSKGFIWMASRDAQVLLWNQAAGSIDLELLAYWKAAVVKDPLCKLLPEEIQLLQKELEKTDPIFGDRLNELTIIGTARDRETFTRELQACFCTPEEIRRWQNGATFDDPWPKELRKVA